MQKISIYQVFTRLFGNVNKNQAKHGTRAVNGVGKMNDFSEKALDEIRKLGISHVWYTGIIEHARCEGNPEYNIADGFPSIIKGRAGSPYAISDYYDVNPDLAADVPSRMAEFDTLVARTHAAGMKVIIDFVPNHVARDYGSDVFPDRDFGVHDDKGLAFSTKNDFYYIPDASLVLPEGSGTLFDEDENRNYAENPAKATGNDNFSAYPTMDDWYETVKLNYGVDYHNGNSTQFDPHPPVWDKMVQILKYWANKGVDGFRCDMVEMVPVAFWNFAIPEVKKDFPELCFIAEVYNPALYHDYIHHGKFDYLYDKVGLYDTLKNIICHNAPASDITKSWQALNELDAYMLRFLENHDEQRFASRFFAGDTTCTLPALIVSAFMHTGPIMTYFGQELGEPGLGEPGYSGDDGRTTIFDYYAVPEFQKWVNNKKFDGGGLSEEQRALRITYQQVLNFAINNEVFASGSFYDLMWVNQFEGGPNTNSVYAFLRYSGEQRMLIIVNFNKDASQQFLLKIPEDALRLMNLSDTSVIDFTPMLFAPNSVSIEGQSIINTGAWFSLSPSQASIYSF